MTTVPISVVIPAYNSERFIRQAIESVLTQTISVDEIIVVDNNCTDRTVEIADELGAKVVKETKQNLSAARNKGISVCRNDWIAFLDSDDLWEKEKIEFQWKVIETFPKARIITCDSFMFIDSTRAKISPPKIDLRQKNLETSPILGEDVFFCSQIKADLFDWIRINASSVVIHQEVFSEIGTFDETLLHVEAVEFFMRAFALFPVALVKKCLASIRKHDQNRTLNRDDIDKFYILAAEKIAKSPDDYPIGTLDYFREVVKLRFTSKGKHLAKQMCAED